jgi:hypothetical protein
MLISELVQFVSSCLFQRTWDVAAVESRVKNTVRVRRGESAVGGGVSNDNMSFLP